MRDSRVTRHAQWYTKALKLAEEQIGAHEAITETFRKSYRAAKEVWLAMACSDAGARSLTRPLQLVRERTVFPTAHRSSAKATAPTKGKKAKS